MIVPPSGVRVWLATGATDMRRGMNSLALQVQEALHRDPHLCVGQDYVAEVLRRLARAGRTACPPPHNIQMLPSSCRTASFGRNRMLRSAETPAFSSPRRIISTSAAAYRWVVATWAWP